jgi:hypothetical protein
MEHLNKKDTVKDDTRKLTFVVVSMLMFVVVIFGVIPLI